ncbi:hypothetical protein BDZ97DRAFT_1964788 [Flammula alnicola]|nr:hypothetical protein BDZ97DRAFT_1964788 [Flammula alnicola]
MGALDAIFTSDSDSFVFGAQCVIRSASSLENAKLNLHHDELAIYNSHVIENDESVMLTGGGLLLIALAVGGDYSAGLEGCGASTVHALAKSGFGDSLLNAVQTLDSDRFETFRQKWIQDIKQELTSNAHGHLSSRQPKLAANIPADFPERSTIDLYVHPVTSFSTSSNPPDISLWKRREPQIHRIATFCDSHLGWQDHSELLKAFHGNLWEGFFLQLLYNPELKFDPVEAIVHTSSLEVQVLKAIKQERRAHRNFHLRAWNRITFETGNFVKEVKKAFPDVAMNIPTTRTIWAPACIFAEPLAGKQIKSKKRKSQHTEEKNTSCSSLLLREPHPQKKRRSQLMPE